MMNKILIVGPSWVGDMVVAQTLFKACRDQNPTARIDVLAPKWSRPLLDFMPEVDTVIAIDANHGELAWRERRQIARSLATEGYEQAIIVPRSFKSALIPYWAKIPKRTGWLGEWRWPLLNDIRQLDKQRFPSLRERYQHLAHDKHAPCGPLTTPHLQVQTQQQQAVITQFNLDTTQPIVALCPGAEYGPAKRWPSQYFAECARALSAAGHTVWILGSPNDQTVADEIQQLSQNVCINLVGKTRLSEAIACLSLAQAVVCNDSGLMHIAAALNIPLVAIYGSSDPNYTPPLTARATIVSKQLACSPCFKRVCPLGHTDCLAIPATKVLDALSPWLDPA